MKIYTGILPENDKIDKNAGVILTPAELSILSQIPEFVRVSHDRVYILLDESTGGVYGRIKSNPNGNAISPAKLIEQKIREYIQMLMIENALKTAMVNNAVSLRLSSMKEDMEQGTDAWLSINETMYPVDIVQGERGGLGKLERMPRNESDHRRTIIAVDYEAGVYSTVYNYLIKSSRITNLSVIKERLLSGISVFSDEIRVKIMNPLSLKNLSKN